MRHLLNVLLIVAALTASFTASAEAKLYRWTDSAGIVHYGDQPTSNAKEVTPKVPTLASTVPSRSAASAPPAVAVPENCQRKKDQLASYRGAAKITETNSLGETREYNEEQRQKLIDTTEQAVHAACDPS